MFDDFEVDVVFDEKSHTSTPVILPLSMSEIESWYGYKFRMGYLPGFLESKDGEWDFVDVTFMEKLAKRGMFTLKALDVETGYDGFMR